MADHALFVGWGEVTTGREQQAAQVFAESLQFYGRLQQQGTIASVEPFFLEPHGGDLGGFVLLRGERDRLAQVRSSAEFLRLIQRATFVVNRVGGRRGVHRRRADPAVRRVPAARHRVRRVTLVPPPGVPIVRVPAHVAAYEAVPGQGTTQRFPQKPAAGKIGSQVLSTQVCLGTGHGVDSS